MKNKFWKGKKVLVTGYEGFLGSNLTKRLLSYQTRVFGLDKVTFRRETILSKEDLAKVNVIRGNVANYKLLKEVMSKYKIEFVFHLAAEAIVVKCLKYPLQAFSSNIRGTWNILETCQQTPSVKAIIVSSSDKAYGPHENLPYNEQCSLAGTHPYDVSKSCADLLARTYSHTYGLPVWVTRVGNS